MAHLYCSKDGQEYAQTLSQKSPSNFAGDGVIITKGTLKSGQWQCEKCKASLKEGDQAYFINFLTSEMVDEFAFYDFADEYSYFDNFDADEIELFGLEWPD